MPARLLRLPTVMERVGLGKTTIYARIKAGTFPKPRDLGGGIVAWREDDIDSWIESRPEVDDSAA